CPAFFQTQDQMKAHKTAVHPVKKAECGNCAKEFTTPFNRDKHENICMLRSEAELKRATDRKERNKKRHQQHEQQQQQQQQNEQEEQGDDQDGEPLRKRVRVPKMSELYKTESYSPGYDEIDLQLLLLSMQAIMNEEVDAALKI